MIKDLVLKAFFIPLLGIGLPLMAGLITYERYTLPELIAANLLFMTTSLVIWIGCNAIHRQLRPLYRPLRLPLPRVLLICVISSIYGALTGGAAAYLWLSFSREPLSWSSIYRFQGACIVAVVIFTLLYEVIFLGKERELDTKIVDQLDKERSHAELQALRNELDPHFIFNSLNTLNHLITEQPAEAYRFNNRLAQVYKYFLLNKNKELISLKEELEFIHSYFYLLQIRHDDKLKLQMLSELIAETVLIPPCSLQVLVENAIKHNEFSEKHPLLIRVGLDGPYLHISNRIRPKPYAVDSTGIGLRNLGARYRILFSKSISVETTNDEFIVKLPLLTKTDPGYQPETP